MHSSSTNSPVALVTGASGIIGPGILKQLRQNGWRIAASERDPAAVGLYTKAFGVPLDADEIFYADLSTRRACHCLVEEVEERLGPISAVVNNAAFNSRLALESIDEKEIQDIFAVNVFAPIWLVQAALPSLREQKGAVVNISSVLVNEPAKDNLLYSCTKAALEKATEMMSAELLGSGVRFNAIRVGRVPGYAILRKTFVDLTDEEAFRMSEELLPQWINEMAEKIGEHAVGSPVDIGRTVRFLISPEARFINGQIVTLDGGYGWRQDAPVASSDFQRRVQKWITDFRARTRLETSVSAR